jgi:DNA-binding transcriptional regulator LsrR (DeoR family)
MPPCDALTEAVLRRYYLEDATKLEIGKEFGISRFKVARLLDDAKRRGLVRIEILPGAADLELSETLRRALGLRRAIVVSRSVGSDAESIRRSVGRLGAQLLTEVAGQQSVVGFSSSRGMVALGEAIESFHDRTVVQLNGVPPHQATGGSPVELVRMIAAKSTGHSRVYYAPFVLPTAAAARDLRRDPMVRWAMSAYSRLNVAVVTVGAMHPGASGIWESTGDREHAEILAKGGVGEVCGILFDAAGRHVETSLAARTLAIGYRELSAVPEVIAVVDAEDRVDAVLAVAKGKHITSLVTSDPIARALIRLAGRAGETTAAS